MSYPFISDETFYSAKSLKQEQFAGAHIRAICSSLGCSINKPEPDDDKIDFTISSRVRGTVLNKPKIDIQSKCKLVGQKLSGRKDFFSYVVDKSLYDNHRDACVSTPRILVVTLVPYQCNQWIKYGHDATILSFCSYWFSLKGMPELEDGVKSKTLRIPIKNIFCASFLHTTMQKIADGKNPFDCGAL